MAKYRPRGIGLERALGTRALAATAYGDVGSSIYYALGLVAIFALGLTPIVYVIAGAIFVMTAMTYAEATANFPEAGGASSFARRAFNEAASFFAGWAQILNYVITVSISAFFVPHYLSVFWEPMRHAPADVIGGIAIVVGLTVINMIGVRESARLNQVLAFVDFATQALLVMIGVSLVLSVPTLIHNVHLGLAPSWGNFAVAIPVAMVSYTGMETISNMAEEARGPRLSVPRAYKILVVAVLVIYAFLPAIALSAMPVTQTHGHYTTTLATTFQSDPILGIVRNMPLGIFQTPMKIYVGILASTILLVAANAGTIGVSRLTYSLGQHQQLPERLRRISPKSRTPAFALGVFGVLASIAMLPGKATFLGNMYAFGAMLSFTAAHVSLVGIRWRLSRDRMKWLPGDVEVANGEDTWYRAPLNARVRGVDVPLFAVIGGLGTAAAWITEVALHSETAYAGGTWLLAGLVTYVAYRRHVRLSLTETAKLSLPPPTGATPVSYASVLLAFEENTFSETALSTALKLASHRHGDFEVAVTLEVPQHLNLAADLGETTSTAQSIIEASRQWAGRGLRVHGKVLRVRPGEAGHRIVREALEARTDAIVMAMPHSRPPGKLLNRTLEVVLAKRPCRVVIDSQPARPFGELGGAGRSEMSSARQNG